MNTNNLNNLSYKIISLFNLVNALRKAYVSACNSLRTANKLKGELGKFARSRALKLCHTLRKELKKYDTKNTSLFESVSYRGVLVGKI